MPSLRGGRPCHPEPHTQRAPLLATFPRAPRPPSSPHLHPLHVEGGPQGLAPRRLAPRRVLQHVGRKVEADHAPAGPHRLRQAEGEVAGAAADVERGGAGARAAPLDRHALPHAVQAQRQLVVQLVVHRRDGVEQALPLRALAPRLEKGVAAACAAAAARGRRWSLLPLGRCRCCWLLPRCQGMPAGAPGLRLGLQGRRPTARCRPPAAAAAGAAANL